MKYEDASSSVNAYTVCTEEPLRCSTNEYTNTEDGYTDRHTRRSHVHSAHEILESNYVYVGTRK